MIQPMSQPVRKATAADLAALYGEDSRYEIIHGEIVEKDAAREDHSASCDGLHAAISHRFARRKAGRWPGGWWIRPELHVQYQSGEVFCHDYCGFRRDRVPEMPKEWPTPIRPDWVCELVSRGHEKRDLVDKWKVLQAAGVPHYWVIKPESRILQVYRWNEGGYVCLLSASAGDVIRAEPFDAVELRASVLFGDEDDDE
jgi:Uma2 family endonuclease